MQVMEIVFDTRLLQRGYQAPTTVNSIVEA